MPDLSPLNPAEREVLGLLAQGHTAKSIASLTGRSIGSVNERLREARRKTGVGSSRELARHWAQENRDEQIGVAPVNTPGTALPPEAAPGVAGGRGKELLVMIPIAITAVLAFTLSSQDPPKAAPDPLVGDLVGLTVDTPAKFYERLRAETRDAAWAPGTEQQLRLRFAAITGVAKDSLRVTCATTICEVAGVLEGANADALNRVYQEVQGSTLRDDLSRFGLASGAMGFGGSGSSSASSRFVAYWTRKS
ncbi:DNA-binding CsgD family transcriptional regulator [Sphingomonas naasensis]|uniref:helix-turn-helix domain-containing protein n=1 Tax=Sphingomonas naasensis TaxID=1344951 RepID=UPI001F0DA6C7|nr:helix-turn-helix transcriptional regulator [Sphingomonas naasensis]NIJ19554.1 DNA-binding CsgD family transcriptional regulator [Sphingomonas naasensis]